MTSKEYIDEIIATRGQWAEEVYESGLCEMHHIDFASKGGDGDFYDKRSGKWKFKDHSHHKNCVYLYPHEHFEVHRLAYEENPKDPSCYWAYWRMAQNGDKEGFIDCWEYEKARKAFIESISGDNHADVSGKNNPMFGKINKGRRGKPAWNSGKKGIYSKDYLAKLSKKTYCEETDKWYDSQTIAARELKVPCSYITRYFKGEIDNVKGYHFKREVAYE